MSKERKSVRKRTVALAIGAALYLFVLHIGLEQRKAATERAADGNRTIAVSRIAGAYAHNNEGEFPPLDPARRFSYAPSEVSLAYEIAKDPEDENAFVPVYSMIVGDLGHDSVFGLEPVWDPAKFWYLGFATTNEREGLALANAVHGSAPLTDDIQVPKGEGTLGTAKLYRLHMYLLKTLVGDGVLTEEDPAVRYRIPILIQRPVDGHAWVVYLDFHTEYLPYPGPYPLTEKFIQALD